MTTSIRMQGIELAKGSFQVWALGRDGAFVDTPCLASEIFNASTGALIRGVSGL
jgi:hypothetical protein